MIYLYGDNVLALDGDLKQAHSAKATITEFPLEDGSFTTDHTILKPKIFTLSAGVMDSSGPIDVYATLLSFRDNRTLLDVQANLTLYSDYLIESINATEEADTGDLVMFDLTFKEVKFSKSKQVKIERKQLKDSQTKDKLQSKTNRGHVDHKEVTVEKVSATTTEQSVESDNSSVLYRILK